MLTSERQRLIKEQALKTGEVTISGLAKRFDVSIETIRRDINMLAEKNLLKKYMLSTKRRIGRVYIRLGFVK